MRLPPLAGRIAVPLAAVPLAGFVQTSVPEPSSVALLVLGLASLAYPAVRRRRRRPSTPATAV